MFVSLDQSLVFVLQSVELSEHHLVLFESFVFTQSVLVQVCLGFYQVSLEFGNLLALLAVFQSSLGVLLSGLMQFMTQVLNLLFGGFKLRFHFCELSQQDGVTYRLRGVKVLPSRLRGNFSSDCFVCMRGKIFKVFFAYIVFR